MRNTSITLKLCLLLISLTIGIAVIVGVGSIKDADNIVQPEMGKLNYEILSEISDNISILLLNIEEIGTTITEDNKLNKILSKKNIDEIDDAEFILESNSYVDGILNEQVWKNGNYNIKPELYIIAENGMNFSTYSKNKYDIESVKNEEWYNQILEANGKNVLISSFEDEDGIGPYKVIFRMGRTITDLITGEFLGVLVTDVSEKMLYDRYSKLLKDGRDIYVIDYEGSIISSKDKRLIGENYYKNIDYGKYSRVEEWYSIFERDSKEYMKIESTLSKYDWRIVEEIPLEIIRQPIKEITEKFLLTIILVIITTFFAMYAISLWITNPIIRIKETIEKVMAGDLKAKIKVERYDEIGVLEESFNNMISWLDESIEEIKEQEKEKRMAELSFLQAQINPHFLYNTLSGARFLVSMNKTKEAEEMLYRFSKVLRNILPKASEMISIREEVEIIKDYIELQKIRYPEGFEVEFAIDDNVLDYKVPALILQPIVENAIFYSMENVEGKGVISINAYEDIKDVKIEILDNGKGMSTTEINNIFEKKEGINRVGLINVHERLQLCFGKDYGIEILSEEGRGTVVIFKLPKEGGTND